MAANNLRVVTLRTSSGLDALVDPDGADALPRDDPFSTGLLQAMWSAMFAITESAALWWALSPGRWAEIGDARFRTSSAARRRRSNSSAGPGQEEWRATIFAATLHPAINPQSDDVAVTV